MGGIQNRLRGAVVLLQLDDLSTGKVLLEIEDVEDVCAAPGVDALVIIAHYADVAMLQGQELTEHVLNVIGVLELIHHDVLPPFPIALQRLRRLIEQPHREGQQIVVVERVIELQPLLIEAVDLDHGFVQVCFRPLGQRLRADELILGGRDAPQDGGRRQPLLINAELAADAFDERVLLAVIRDGEVPVPADSLNLVPEQAGANGVEGADTHRERNTADKLRHPLFHLIGGFVGERHRQHIGRRHLVIEDQMRDAVSQHTRFARPRASQDQHRPVHRLDGLTLRRV